ncbi:MAG: hypothetical protein ACKVHE_24530 [Planctomycetales bacterium]
MEVFRLLPGVLVKWILWAGGTNSTREFTVEELLNSQPQKQSSFVNRDGGAKGKIMANASSAKKARQERRLRSPGFLKSLGVERTTAFLVGAAAGLLFAFVTILTADAPPATDANTESPESVFEAAELADTSR